MKGLLVQLYKAQVLSLENPLLLHSIAKAVKNLEDKMPWKNKLHEEKHLKEKILKKIKFYRKNLLK